MRNTKKQTQEEIATDLLWNEVMRFRQMADPLLTIDYVTELMVEHQKRDGYFSPDEWQNFYNLIRLLTQIAKLEENLKVVA